MRPTGHIPFSMHRFPADSLHRFPADSLRSSAGFLNPQSKIRNSQSAIRRGFTLLEVLLAVSLVVLLAGGVYAFYAHVLGARTQIASEGRVIFAQRRILDLLAGELQSVRTTLEGSSDRLSFTRTAVPGRAVFLTPNITRGPSITGGGSGGAAFEPQHDIQLVAYRLNRYEDDDGVEQVGGIERTCMRTVRARVAEEGENVEVVLLTEHVRFIRLQYWDGSEWFDSWSGRELPQAVRIRLGKEPLPAETPPEEYPYETVWRVVAIPAGLYQDSSGDSGGGRTAGAGSSGSTGRTGMFNRRRPNQ